MPVSPSSCILSQIGSSESSTCRPSRIRICTGAERACRCASPAANIAILRRTSVSSRIACVAGQREVEHRLGQRGLGAEPLVDALRRDAGLGGNGGDRGRPVAVALELLARREHHGQPPGAGLRAPPGRVVGPLDFRHPRFQTLDTVQLYLKGVTMTTSPYAAVSAGPVSLVVRSIHAMAK